MISPQSCAKSSRAATGLYDAQLLASKKPRSLDICILHTGRCTGASFCKKLKAASERRNLTLSRAAWKCERLRETVEFSQHPEVRLYHLYIADGELIESSLQYIDNGSPVVLD